MGALNVHTETLSGEIITISSSDNVVRLSIVGASGSVTLNGSSYFQGRASSAVTFATGEGITLTSPSVNNPIDGVTIDATSGTCDLVISTQ